MGSLKSPCTTSYRSSIETTALNCLVFEKIALFQFGDRQTDEQTNKWTRSSHEAALAVASGGLITLKDTSYRRHTHKKNMKISVIVQLFLQYNTKSFQGVFF